MHQRLTGIAAEIHADGIIDRRHAASAMPCHDQRLLEPNTEENRIAPCEGCCGVGGGEAGGGAGGCGGWAWVAGCGARSYGVRCCAAVRAGANGSGAVAGTAARAPPPSLRDDIRLNSSRSGHFAFSAATCTHWISAVFLASRRWAFMSPSR